MNKQLSIFYQEPRSASRKGRLVIHWTNRPELETNIKHQAQLRPNADVDGLAKLFLQQIRLEPLAPKHLEAFLQKFGYWAANRLYGRLSDFQQYRQLQVEQSDLWQIGWLVASQTEEFFRCFKPQFPVANYSHKTMERKIQEEIFRNSGMEAIRDSRWGLLRKSSRKKLREALQHRGYESAGVDRYLLAWECFKEVYVEKRQKKRRALPEPSESQWQQMAQLYEQLLSGASGTSGASGAKVNGMQIKIWLTDCIQALQKYLTPKVGSLNSSAGEGKKFAELLDCIPATEAQPELEIQAPMEELRSLVPELLARLDEESDRLLLLRYGLELTGRAIAPFFQLDQSNISRRYNRVSQRLLKQVAVWAKTSLGVNPDSGAIAEMKAPLEELLKQHYRVILRSQFGEALAQLNNGERLLLHWHYIQKQNKSAIAARLQLPEAEIAQNLAASRQVLEGAIGLWLQNRLSLSPDALLPLQGKISRLVEEIFLLP